MDADVIKAFTSAAREVLLKEMGWPVEIKEPRLKGGPYRVEEITVAVGLAKRIEGSILLGLSRSTAMQYLSHALGETVGDLNALAVSGISELGNVIAGTAASKLSEIGYDMVIAPPTVLLGGGTISTLTLNRLVFPVVVRFGTIDLQLAARVKA